MKTWLLMAIDPRDRLYRGHEGYADDLRKMYRYDSFVPNYRQLKPGDVVIIRNKREVLGCAIIDRIDAVAGTKHRNRCPSCKSTKIKERVAQAPRFRCECGATFHTPVKHEEPCTEFAAHFGSTFQDLAQTITIPELWALAPRLNKQLAMLEIDSRVAAELLARVTDDLGRSDEPTVAARALYAEGERTTVLVNRYERDPRARQVCIAHYGRICTACGFDFAARYGPLGAGVIEIHHLEPLSASTARTVDPIRDLRPLCSNCHTIVHRRTPPLTVEELKAMLET